MSVDAHTSPRIARLKAMEMRGEESLRALGNVHCSSLRPRKVWIRSGFARLMQPVHGYGVPRRSQRPPATGLIYTRGIAQQFYLIALFEAQCRTRRGGKTSINTRPLARDSRQGEYGWLDLAGPCTGITSGRPVAGSTLRDKQLRQIRHALSVLSSPERQLVTLTEPPGDRGRYERFQLVHDGKRGRAGELLPYAVPWHHESEVFSLDARLFTNGWVHILEEPELAFICMLADLQSRADHGNYVSIPENERVAYYGLGADTYRSHQLLNLAGIVDVEFAEGRREDGTYAGHTFHRGGQRSPLPHQFHLRSNAFDQPALPTVLDALTELSTSAGPPASSRRSHHWDRYKGW